jgi:hypothetical protein
MFRNVKLPALGDDQYSLWLSDGSGGYSFQTALEAGTAYFFAGTGVSSFSVLGIEESLGRDPSSATAFVTTITFSGDGRLTGTMTPITVAVVPEPQAWILMALGLGWLVMRSAKRHRACRRGQATADA